MNEGDTIDKPLFTYWSLSNGNKVNGIMLVDEIMSRKIILKSYLTDIIRISFNSHIKWV